MTAGSESTSDSCEPAAIHAIVLASLPNGMFRLQMPDGREVAAHAALDLRKAFTRLIAGDQVRIELSPFDPNRARITQHRRFNVSQPLPPNPPQ